MTQQVSIHRSSHLQVAQIWFVALMQARRFKHLYGSYGKALLAEESASNEHFAMV